MKKISLLIFSLLASLTLVYAQADKMSFNETTHDFGVIGEKDGKVSFDFIVTNNSNEPLVIAKVNASCGCTAPSWSKAPIEPGKTGTITATYNPQGRPGRFNKSISVTTNFSPAPMTLYIKGEVKRPEVNPEILYPVEFDNVRFKKTPELDFGTLTSEETKKIKIEIYNSGTTDFSSQFAGLPSFITLTGGSVSIPAKSSGVLEFVLNAAEIKKYGNQDGAFTLTPNSQKVIPYKVNLQDNFDHLTADERKNAGKINVSSEKLIFNKSSRKPQILKISNSGKTDLNIKSIQASNPNITFSKTTLVVKPKEIVEINVSYPVNKVTASDLSANISIFSDDPRNSLKEVKVLVNP